MSRRKFDPDALLSAIARGERACADFGMRIDRRGVWHYRGSPIQRPALVKLFAGILRRGPDGGYWLVTPVEQGRIEVEDTPFLIVELRRIGAGQLQRLELRTNLDDWVSVDAAHPLVARPTLDGPDVPCVVLRDRLEARLARPVWYELAELLEPDPEGGAALGVWSAGRFFRLALADG